jgi:hypothetical protein
MAILLASFLLVSLVGWCAFARAWYYDHAARRALARALALYGAGQFLRRHDPYLPNGRTWKRGEGIPKRGQGQDE